MPFQNSGAPTYKRITSSAVVTTAGKPGLLYGVNLQTASAASSLIINDGGSGGTEVIKLALDGSSAANANGSISIVFPEPITCGTDIYATLAGSGAVANVFYKQIV